MGSQEFFLYPAHGKDSSFQRDFTGHGHLLADWNIAQQRDDRSGHTYPGRGTFLGRGRLWDMDVDIKIFVQILGHAQLINFPFNIAEGGLSRFLHDLTQLTSEGEIAFPVDFGNFEGQEFSTEFRPCHAHSNAHFIFFVDFLTPIARNPQVFFQVFRGYSLLISFPFIDHLLNHLAADRRDLPLYISYPGLSCILTDKLHERPVCYPEIILSKTMSFQLLGQEKLFSDLKFFILRVTRKADDFHPIDERSGNGFKHVGSNDEHNLRQIEVCIDVVV